MNVILSVSALVGFYSGLGYQNEMCLAEINTRHFCRHQVSP